jgi:glycine/D-amino acid oxidase-like deaminating enzyme
MPNKAKLCVEGNALLYEFLETHRLPYQKNGKLIVATTPVEDQYLDFFLDVGKRNGVPGIKKITGVEAVALEPNLRNVISALHVPSTGCTSPAALLKKIYLLAKASGVKFRLGVTVVGLAAKETSCTITTKTETGTHTLKTEFLINAAGLYADDIARLINSGSPYEIEPVRGEFCEFDKADRPEININGMHIYGPPYCYTTEEGVLKIVSLTPAQLTKRLASGTVKITAGVHLSPTYRQMRDQYVLENVITISPLKTIGLGKEDYTSSLHGKSDYINKVKGFFPNLNAQDITLSHTGIMATLKGHNDFVIERDISYPRCINLIGMDSPAWTSCFAIARRVLSLMEERI